MATLESLLAKREQIDAQLEDIDSRILGQEACIQIAQQKIKKFTKIIEGNTAARVKLKERRATIQAQRDEVSKQIETFV